MTNKTRVSDVLKKYTMILALFIIVIVFEFLIQFLHKGSLFAPGNVSNLIGQNGYVVVLATGMLLCILTGGNIDLSVGSIVVLVGALAGKLLITYKANIFVTILICVLVGTLIGAFQGSLIAYLRIPAFIVTLAGMLIFRGIAWVILQGKTAAPFPNEYKQLFNSFIPTIEGSATDPAVRSQIFTISLIIGAVACAVIIGLTLFKLFGKRNEKNNKNALGTVMDIVLPLVACVVIMGVAYLLGKNKGIPVITILLVVVVFGYNYFTSKTVPGRHFYAMGGNEKAAKLSGVNTNRILFFAYANMGFLASIAALMCVARFDSAAPSAGQNYEMDAIAACYIGGASAYGGVGTVGGAVIGAIFMGVLNNGMSIVGLETDWQRVVKGVVLLVAVIFDVLSRRRKRTV